MLEWFTAPIDPNRVHEIGTALSWHGRLMVISWGVLAPGAILVARFAKIWPGQDWPRELDNTNWWRLHWIAQTVVIVLALLATLLMLVSANDPISRTHRWLGYGVLLLGLVQVLGGMFRGSKGGPTDAQMRGDHFDMTPHREAFEKLHKFIGYLIMALAIAATLSGLWAANAPMWMFLVLFVFWIGLAVIFGILQHRGYAVDTYQAIWGSSPDLPGNRRKPIGWGIRRIKSKEE